MRTLAAFATILMACTSAMPHTRLHPSACGNQAADCTAELQVSPLTDRSRRGGAAMIIDSLICVHTRAGESWANPHPFKSDDLGGEMPTIDTLPILKWFGGTKALPSDWLDVKKGCGDTNPAVGDGAQDDTAAIQACFDLVSNETKLSTVYLPAGNFKVTKTLRLFRGRGILIVGEGESTQLVWGGNKHGHLLLSDGLSHSRFVGLVFDGKGVADVGFEHSSFSPGLFETRIRHQNNKFVNFLRAGIRIGYNRTDGVGKLETSEVLYENSIFANNGVSVNCTANTEDTATPWVGGCGGVVILNWNDYDNTFDGCHFFNNSYGIYTERMVNVYVRNSRFDSNAQSYAYRHKRPTPTGFADHVIQFSGADIFLSEAAGSSIRRCVSVNSGGAFVSSPYHTAVSPVTLEGNLIDRWKGPQAIDYSLRGPMMLLDVSISGPSPLVAQLKAHRTLRSQFAVSSSFFLESDTGSDHFAEHLQQR
eukprot:SAG31_NODE_7073_length_1796_cov_1.256924_1_plen_478_part_00